MPSVTEADWAGAEAVVALHYKKLGHKTVEVAERFPSWPFMMRLFVGEEFRAYEIVVAGKVATTRGVVPLERSGGWDLVLRRGKPAKWTETLEERVRE